METEELSLDVKLMVCLICDTFDNFDTCLAEVDPYHTLTIILTFVQYFFNDFTYDELKMKSFDVDLTSNDVSELKPLLSNTSDDEIQSMLLFMVKQLRDTLESREPAPSASLVLTRTDMNDGMKDFAESTAKWCFEKYGENRKCLGDNIKNEMIEKYGYGQRKSLRKYKTYVFA